MHRAVSTFCRGGRRGARAGYPSRTCTHRLFSTTAASSTTPAVPHKGPYQPATADSYPFTIECAPVGRYVDFKDAVKTINSNHTIYVSTAASTPKSLVEAFSAHIKDEGLTNINTISIHTEWPAPYVSDPELQKAVTHASLFTGHNIRKSVQDGDAGYMPIHLSEIPSHLKNTPIDVAVISVSPPDAHGYCSLGTSVDVTLTAVRHAKKIIAQVNKHVPRVHGEGIIHINQIDAAVRCDEPLYENHKAANTKFSPEEEAIGRNAAALVEDGACLQLGIGNIPNAIMAKLTGHKRLGVHSEMISDGLLDLIENGNIDNSAKTLHPGETVTAFIFGTKRLYDFVHDNPSVKALSIENTNDPFVIAQNEKMTAINSCISIDLTGQVNSDSIGPKVFSGFGGQVDFMYGSARSKGGKPILALQSSTNKGASKIVPMLRPGAGVVTTRAHVRWVVTEYGAVNLFGKTLPQRARALIDIAHPDHREQLEKDARDVLKLKLPKS